MMASHWVIKKSDQHLLVRMAKQVDRRTGMSKDTVSPEYQLQNEIRGKLQLIRASYWLHMASLTQQGGLILAFSQPPKLPVIMRANHFRHICFRLNYKALLYILAHV